MIPPGLRRHVDKYYGKYSGIVVETDDSEHRGRIRVRVPAVLGDTVVRARPCLPYGHFFIPEPGSKVWIEFEAGDVRHALYVGAWYAADTTPEEAQLDPPTNRVIQTASGHTIELKDTEGEEKIVIRHAGNSFVSIDANGSVTVANQNGSHLFLDAENATATLMSEQGHLVTMSDNGLVLVNDGGAVFELKDTTATVLAENIVLSGSSVALGAGAAEPTLMATAFEMLWNMVLTHTHPSAMGPTGPPLPPLTTAVFVPGTHTTSSVTVK